MWWASLCLQFHLHNTINDCLPSWAKSPAAINQCTLIYISCSLSSVWVFWFVCFKDTSGSHQRMLIPRVHRCQGKGLKRRWIADFCPQWVSVLPACSCGGKTVAAGPTLPLWGYGKTGIERRCGPELLPVGLIGWLQAHVLLAAVYLSYPQHRLPCSKGDWHKIKTNFNTLEGVGT